ncbi:DUF3365 domain-containing protein [Bizionia argentinensis JUB59]|uniref:DUF3365 domain-containing protein n=1 Tax=Bizionia argentinensis JUB59 TaxID=1046627 RepID=G2EDT8_9FLAO|nr:DUF3365 domain-containing protein [Bizionia argentinensis]EGV43388.1 DUF3365 domain-containing protein [Bizionia argentinensis JUB59]
MNLKWTILSFAFLLVVSCKNNNEKKSDYVDTVAINKQQEHPGKKLMEVNCYVCHSPTASHDDRIAPPMVAIKRHYLNDGISKADFISDIQSYVKNPNEADSRMRGAVKRFGVMPKAQYPEKTVAQIADYLYDYDVEQPEWFDDHVKEQGDKGRGKGRGKMNGAGKQRMNQQRASLWDSAMTYEEIGLKYAMSTKAQLGKNLMQTIQKKGTLAAVEFCNVAAYPLTDSMAVAHQANIKRVSDKPRNPDNRANSQELEHIEKFKASVAANREPQAIVEETDDLVKFYYPIVTNTMCLQCHGKTIEPEVYKSIKALYPKDEAIGYMENEVRGIWSISFDKNR